MLSHCVGHGVPMAPWQPTNLVSDTLRSLAYSATGIAMGQNKQQRDGTAVASLFYDVVKTQSDCMFILKLPKNLSACCIPIWPLLLSPAGTAQPKVLS